MSQAVVERGQRQYTHCAKCGAEKLLGPGNFVCEDCHGTPGGFNFCAACGIEWEEKDKPSRCWVCYDDLAHPVPEMLRV